MTSLLSQYLLFLRKIEKNGETKREMDRDFNICTQYLLVGFGPAQMRRFVGVVKKLFLCKKNDTISK